MGERPSAAPPRLLAERDELVEQVFALGGSDELDDKRQKVAAELEALLDVIEAQRSVGLDVLLVGLDAEKAEKVRTAVGLLGAEEIAPTWLCTCCQVVTPMKLKGVPLCAACSVSLIDERDRQLRAGRADPAWSFPVEGQQCNKRGHRDTPIRTRAVPADFTPNPLPKRTKAVKAEEDPPRVAWAHRQREAPLHGEPAVDTLAAHRETLAGYSRDEIAKAGHQLMIDVLGELEPALTDVPRASATRPALERCCPECGEVLRPGFARHPACFQALNYIAPIGALIPKKESAT